MPEYSDWKLEKKEKERLILMLSSELTVLRTKADISQDELANIIGVSRQTYGAIERGSRKMTWNTYLSLVLFYEFNCKTRQMLHSLGIVPKDLIAKFNGGIYAPEVNIGTFLPDDTKDIIDHLDEQALHSIRTMIMLEYARCTGMTGDAVIKSFDGVTYRANPAEADVLATKAVKKIKGKQKF